MNVVFCHCVQSLKLLSVMAAIRLDEKPDKIENVLLSSLMDGTVGVPNSQDRKIRDSADPLASSSWEEVITTFCIQLFTLSVSEGVSICLS